MRKTAVIAALLSFLVCLLAGYYAALWRGEQHPAETQAHAVLEEKKRIHAGTKIVYQYFYTQDRVMKKHIEPAPEFLQGLDLEQLKSIYTGSAKAVFYFFTYSTEAITETFAVFYYRM